MSTHYHAAQSRGFAFSTFEIQCLQWQQTFTGFDPARIAAILHLTYDTEYLYLTYLNRSYRLRLTDGVLEKSLSRDRWTSELFFNEAMSIYHHLNFTCDHPRDPSGTWIPTAELEGMAARRTNLPDPLLDPFAARFAGQLPLLKQACEALNGTPLGRGDVSFTFPTFPQVPLQLIFWDADEDFPAQIQVLADSHAGDYMHRETIGCIVSDLLEKITRTADLCSGSLLPLRPHHGMCMHYYQGKGYSEDFTENMTRMLALMDRSDPRILLVDRTDILCGHCPFHHDDCCETAEKVDRYDDAVLSLCTLPPESVLPVSEFRKLVRDRILTPGLRTTICGDCKWTDLCHGSV